MDFMLIYILISNFTLHQSIFTSILTICHNIQLFFQTHSNKITYELKINHKEEDICHIKVTQTYITQHLARNYIPSEFGFKLTMTDSSTVFILVSLGEGVVAVLVGKTIELYGYSWFLFWLVVISALCIVIVWINQRLITNFKLSVKRVSLPAKDNDIFSNNNIEMKDKAKIQNF